MRERRALLELHPLVTKATGCLERQRPSGRPDLAEQFTEDDAAIPKYVSGYKRDVITTRVYNMGEISIVYS